MKVAVTSPAILPRVDHLVYATGDLERGIAEIEALLGIRAMPGGRHAAWGTCNALVGLGPRCYLEILAPDPDHSTGPAGRLFGLETLGASRLLTWVANGTGLEKLRDSAAGEGVELGDVLSGERQRPDGGVVRWTLTDPRRVLADGVVACCDRLPERPGRAAVKRPHDAGTGVARASARNGCQCRPDGSGRAQYPQVKSG
jgi:hypothetical protein